MFASSQVHGKFELKGVRDFTSLNVGDRRDQYIPGQRRDVTYVSRLQVGGVRWARGGGGRRDQYIPGQRRNVTYIICLQAVGGRGKREAVGQSLKRK